MSEDDADIFRQHVMGVRPLEQDKHQLRPNSKDSAQTKLKQRNALGEKQAAASFAFSDAYQAHFDDTGPLRFCRDDVPKYALKQLRRGEYAPQWVLDCHGMTKEQLKQELLAMLHAAQKDHIACVNILHGIGGGILKQALPNYLVQYPSVRAFHQAPLEYGGHGALLVLLDAPAER